MVKLADIAKELGLSVSVVSRALSSKPDKHAVVKAETVKRIRDYASKVGYKPNRQASFLGKGQCATIFCFLPDIPTRLICDLMFGISEAACMENFPVNFFLGHNAADFDRFLLHSQENAHSGLLTLPPNKMSKDVFKSFCEYHRNGGKVIFLNTVSNASDDSLLNKFSDVPLLNVDDKYGGQLAAEHLIRCGCEEFYLISLRPRQIYFARESGFSEICRQQGFSVRTVTPAELAEMDFDRNKKYGLFADTDYLALDLYQFLMSKGIRFGEEVFLCGFNDIFYSRISCPSLTTIHQPTREEGQRAVHKLVSMIYGKDEQNEWIKPYLMHRETTGGPRPDPECPDREIIISELRKFDK
ncbi:MAG: LacI family DNA-binding transcriptional regulator [Lentisphaeria bacterium]|nr:LacI family DNA-binding transcriptional regulator [Lentisphaeria bacterium]